MMTYNEYLNANFNIVIYTAQPEKEKKKVAVWI